MKKLKLFISLINICILSIYNIEAQDILTSNPQIVCSGSNSIVSLSVPLTGEVKYWEISYSGGIPWFTVNEISTDLELTNITQDTYVRAILYNPETDVTFASNIAVVNVLIPSSTGVISGSATVCSGNSTEISITDYTGDVVNWQSSENNLTWADISNTSNTLQYNNIINERYFRVIVQNGVCPKDTSNSVHITVNQPTVGGTITGAIPVCKGVNHTVLTLTGKTGDIQRWESSFTGETPWIIINEQTTSIYIDNLINKMYYRALVQNTGCELEYSATTVIEVNPQTVGGTVTGSNSVCENNNSGILNLVGNTGEIQYWEFSEDDGLTWNNISTTNQELTFSNLVATTKYRAAVKSGICNFKYSVPAIITVNPLPNPDFTCENVCNNHSSDFYNLSNINSGTIVSYIWDFGNGSSSQITSPSYTYPNAGNYNVKLTATSNFGCIDSIKKNISVFFKPNVDFISEDECLNAENEFINVSSIASGSLSYLWDFGDLTSSNDISPSHLYTNSGIYNVKLIGISENSCKDSIKKIVNVFPNPVAGFWNENVCDGDEMIFHNTSNLNNQALTYNWYFGDGSVSDEKNPQYLYNSANQYNVMLVTFSSNYCSDTIIKQVSVNPNPVTMFEAENECLYNSVIFNNNTLISSGNLTYTWEFGNGISSNETSPLYKYSFPGNYLVKLEAVSDSGCISDFYKNIEIHPVPNTNFYADNVCDTYSVNFLNTSVISSGTLNFYWNFGDGNTSVEAQPKYLYDNYGIYEVELISLSENNCTDTTINIIQVYPNPTADFNTESVCDGKPSEFQNLSIIPAGVINSLLWDFGDGTNSVQENPTHLFLNQGSYSVSLKAFSNFGCSDTVYKTIIVEYVPVADFTVESKCYGFPVEPQNNSYSLGNINYLWDFGDNTQFTVSNPSHIYGSAGNYPIKLKVFSDFGCIDSLIRNVIVFELPKVNAGRDTFVSQGYPVQLEAVGASEYEWLPALGLENPFVAQPFATPLQTTDYVVTGTDYHTCVFTDTVKVEVLNDFRLEATNVITPNGDNINDTWYIKNITTFEGCNLYIYDRWGKLVYETRNYQNNWDGRNSNNDVLPDGTYYYVIEFGTSEKSYNGAVTILRDDE